MVCGRPMISKFYFFVGDAWHLIESYFGPLFYKLLDLITICSLMLEITKIVIMLEERVIHTLHSRCHGERCRVVNITFYVLPSVT